MQADRRAEPGSPARVTAAEAPVSPLPSPPGGGLSKHYYAQVDVKASPADTRVSEVRNVGLGGHAGGQLPRGDAEGQQPPGPSSGPDSPPSRPPTALPRLPRPQDAVQETFVEESALPASPFANVAGCVAGRAGRGLPCRSPAWGQALPSTLN